MFYVKPLNLGSRHSDELWSFLISALRHKFVRVLDRSALCFHTIGLTPNSSTLLGFAFAALAGVILSLRVSDEMTYVVAPCLILVSGFFDAIDGSLAKLYASVTKFGGVLDSTFDRFGEIVVLSSMVIVGLSDAFWGLAAIAGSTMVSYVRARVEVEGVKMSGVGIAERPERMLILVAGLFLRSAEYGVILVAIFSGITVAQRILYAYRHLG